MKDLNAVPLQKKKVSDFPPSPAGMSLTKLYLAGNSLIVSRQGKAFKELSWVF
jgi:hypothetical protein